MSVYVICANNGEVKVGLSGAPYSRLSEIKKEYSKRRNFTDAYIYGFVDTSFSAQTELFSHRFLKAYCSGGEWFRVHPLLAASVVVDAALLFQCDAAIYFCGQDDLASKKVARNFIRKRINELYRGRHV